MPRSIPENWQDEEICYELGAYAPDGHTVFQIFLTADEFSFLKGTLAERRGLAARKELSVLRDVRLEISDLLIADTENNCAFGEDGLPDRSTLDPSASENVARLEDLVAALDAIIVRVESEAGNDFAEGE